MKTVNSEIQHRKTEIVDAIPEVKVALPNEKRPTQVPKILNPVLNYTTYKNVGRGMFISSEYDLAQIGRIEDTESFVRQSFDKKVALMFKEGFDLVGKNPKTVRYIKIRLAQIARASGVPTLELLRSMGSSLIRKSNTFALKVRNTDASGGKIRVVPGSSKELKPIAAYFIIPAESLEVSADNYKIYKWRQRMPDGQYNDYNPDDIVHMYFDRKDGFVYGTPTIIPVIDDIRALRKIEENIELLIYQHLFPLFQFQVGTEDKPAGLNEEGEREVDVLKREIQYMPTEGGIVTTERHKITAIGLEGRALRAETYLEHFKKRVVAGLGISMVDLGDGDTTNRATSDNMSRNLIDSVKDFQQVLEYFFNELIINELLLESTFGEEVLDEENRVYLRFKEIDIDTQIKKEAHYADQFNKDMITHDEARIRMGYDPITLPTMEEQQRGEDLSLKYPEWQKTRWKMFEEPKLLIQAIDEPWSLAAQAAVANAQTAITPSHQNEAAKAGEATMKKELKAQGDQQVRVAKAKPKPKAKDAFLSERFGDMENGIVTYITGRQEFNHAWVSQMVRASMKDTIDYMLASQMTSFKSGYSNKASTRTNAFITASRNARIQFRTRAERYINKLVDDLLSSLKSNVSPDMAVTELGTRTRFVFDTLKFRTDFIEDVEIRKAFTYGEMIGQKIAGNNQLKIVAHEDACEECLHLDGTLFDTSTAAVEDVPPFHASCHCRLVQIGVTDSVTVENSSLDGGEQLAQQVMGDLESSGQVVKCTRCDRTAIKVKDTPDVYVCRHCNFSFRKESK